ncbi:YolD-like family protein [Bacillaceae bacterium W0354]
MKANKLTKGHNLMWESSRMMLPEHKEVIREHQKKLTKKEKPLLDEQEVEVMERQILNAIQFEKDVEVHLFHPYETITLTGKIMKINPQQRRIKLKMKSDIEWLTIDDITYFEIKDSNF